MKRSIRRALTLCCALALTPACGGYAPPPVLAGAIPHDPPYALTEASSGDPATRRGGSPTVTKRDDVVRAARQFATGTPLRVNDFEFEMNPVGFVQASFWQVGIDVFDASVVGQAKDGMEILYRSSATRFDVHRTTPRPGDIVFWDEKPQSRALYPSQVGIVEAVHPDGTITTVGVFADGPRRVLMNLREPDLLEDGNGRTLNHRMGGLPAAQLFREFADPWG